MKRSAHSDAKDTQVVKSALVKIWSQGTKGALEHLVLGGNGEWQALQRFDFPLNLLKKLRDEHKLCEPDQVT